MKTCVVGIDASRNRSGGGKHHLVGILSAGDPTQFGIRQVHVWAYQGLIELLPDAPWLVKHAPADLDGSLLQQMRWQRRSLPVEMRRCGCDILLSTDAGTIGSYEPSAVMSRDLLAFSPGEIARYPFSGAWLRLLALRYVQIRSLRRARGAIFLTRYAAETIQRFSGRLRNVAIIPHGVGEGFRANGSGDTTRFGSGPIRCLYVSNAELYKHQWQVIWAVGELRKRGHDVVLTLAGGNGPAQPLVDKALAEVDPRGEFVKSLGAVEHGQLPALISQANVFIFASSCENMPNTLLEGMAGGLPIACSDRGPMPEVLQDGGVYFDPEQPQSIAAALERLILDEPLRTRVAERARELAEQFSWTRCARETWTFLRQNAAG